MAYRVLFRSLLLPTMLVGGALASACGPSETMATFTSEVVQRESCRLIGASEREVCTRDPLTTRVRVTLIEDSEKRVWMNGVPRKGAPGRTILGTRDQLGGYLFYDETVQTNTNSGCRLTESVMFSLHVDEEAPPEAVGVDDCVALLGREIRVTTTSPECDTVNDPPQQIQRILRRRWQPADNCDADVAVENEAE